MFQPHISFSWTLKYIFTQNKVCELQNYCTLFQTLLLHLFGLLPRLWTLAQKVWWWWSGGKSCSSPCSFLRMQTDSCRLSYENVKCHLLQEREISCSSPLCPEGESISAFHLKVKWAPGEVSCKLSCKVKHSSKVCCDSAENSLICLTRNGFSMYSR